PLRSSVSPRRTAVLIGAMPESEPPAHWCSRRLGWAAYSPHAGEDTAHSSASEQAHTAERLLKQREAGGRSGRGPRPCPSHLELPWPGFVRTKLLRIHSRWWRREMESCCPG